MKEAAMKPDAQLQRDVLDELEWEQSIDAAQIGVAAKDGVVTLTGHAPVYADKIMAAEVAKRVHGVKAVANDILVRPSDGSQLDDADIAAAVVHALKWDAVAPDECIQIIVEDGWITLEGTVDRQYQKEAADRVVRHLDGARGVTNAILVEPCEPPDGMRARIEAAYRRSALVDSRRIAVEADNGIVRLCGDLHSHVERDEAERIAWTAPGTIKVENCITITPWGYGPSDEWGY
jgi:osmotically-inducible protein OsmY